MIDLSVSRSAGAPRALRIFGIGGAGANVLDRMVLDGVNASHLVAVNTDSPALQASVAGQKLQIGESVTRGLGAGGDPELGRAAAEESFSVLRPAVSGLDAVFLLGGLGGGTASGTLPAMARLARQEGALVIVFATMPFSFEGKRRCEQAQEALCGLKQEADAVICFENDLMGAQVSPRAGIAQAFAVADQILSQSVRAVAALLHRKGLINLGFDDLKAALAGNRARTLFAHGEADGNNRPYDALARALKGPLMDKGRLLRDCETILVQVTGGPEMTLTEVELLMEEFNRKVEQRSRLLFGVAADARSEGRMSVTIFATLAEEAASPPLSLPAAEELAPPQKLFPVAVEEKEATAEIIAAAPSLEAIDPVEPAAAVEVVEEVETVETVELISHEEPAVSPESEETPPRRGDGLDAIFGPRVTSISDSAVDESRPPSVTEITATETPTVPDPPANITAFHAIIDEEVGTEDGLEPLVPLEPTTDAAEPAPLPSFVIEEEEPQEALAEEEIEEAPVAEEEPEEPTVTEEEPEEPIVAAEPAPAEVEAKIEEALSGEETQTTLFAEEGGSIFSRPLTRATRPMPGRTLGAASPFFEESTSLPLHPEEGDDEREEAATPIDEGATVEESIPEETDDEWEESPFKEESPAVGASVPEPLHEAEPAAAAPPPAIHEEVEPVAVANQDRVSEEKTATVMVETPAGENPPIPPSSTAERREEPLPPAPPAAKPAPARAPQQETLKFESARRGRFEKSEPTIEDGQDLDIPTFLRRNIKIRPQ